MSKAKQGTESPRIRGLKQALVDGGFEIYRLEGESILLAERVRMHLMESGVRLDANGSLRVSVRIRAQRSDFPGDDADTILGRVRDAITPMAEANGFTESAAGSRDILHPSETDTVLDVWHEVTFSKVVDEDALHEQLRWALALPRCVSNTA